MDNLTQKYLLYKKFVASYWNKCSTAPLADYINNPIYQELTDEEAYDGNKSSERIYLDLRVGWGFTNEAKKLKRKTLRLA